ncbi:hypothetical protein HA49_18980 [Tatumella morbirosei]|uniref:UPF0231 protein HA49_18980 n=1 Tax=Tatumella morbirosei TaxID=642227 RepID=A0A095T1B0_9GAMM|nr:YacL family protein [Tatumella morbirosei]KGD70522.1 hypothetical protein HA49_18980 [Tatumella morbirosei]
MEYQFVNDVTGNVIVRMSMDHEAVGHWFNEEVQGDMALLDEVVEASLALKGTENQWQKTGKEYTLLLDAEEVMIGANLLSFDTDELEEGMAYYDQESLSFCGLEDFLQLIAAYREFARGR